MFGFLKDKLKGALKKFSDEVEEEIPEESEAETESVPKKQAKPSKKSEKPKPKKSPAKKPSKTPTPPKDSAVTEDAVSDDASDAGSAVVKDAEPADESVVEQVAPDGESHVEDKKEESAPSEAVDTEIASALEDVEEDDATIKETAEEEHEAEEVIEEEMPRKKGFFSRIFKGKSDEPSSEESADEVASGASIDDADSVEDEPSDDEHTPNEDVADDEEDVESDELVGEPEDDASEDREPEAEEEKPQSGFFSKLKEGISGKTLSADKFEDLFFELEVALLENNVAVEVIEKIKSDLKTELVDKKLNRFEIANIIKKTLQNTLTNILSVDGFDLVEKARAYKADNKPLVIAFVGINGSGKTTSIAKVAHLMLQQKLSVVLGAADTFRAAAIQQLEEHANNLGVKIIKHDYGSDPAAVAFDTVKYAKLKNIDVVLIDTAGRMHSDTNLVNEMKKIMRVAQPDIKIFVGESITGNDCVDQAQQFDGAVGVDGIILAKADVDEKGGAAISVSYVTGKPILYLGMGQEYKDLQKFDKTVILKNLGL